MPTNFGEFTKEREKKENVTEEVQLRSQLQCDLVAHIGNGGTFSAAHVATLADDQNLTFAQLIQLGKDCDEARENLSRITDGYGKSTFSPKYGCSDEEKSAAEEAYCKANDINLDLFRLLWRSDHPSDLDHEIYELMSFLYSLGRKKYPSDSALYELDQIRETIGQLRNDTNTKLSEVDRRIQFGVGVSRKERDLY